MSKMTTLIIVMSGLMLLFYFTGLLSECDEDGLCEAKTPNGKLLDLILNPERMQTSPLWLKIVAAISGLSLVGAVIIANYYARLEMGVISAVVIWIASLMWDFIAVFNVVREANLVFALLIFSPMLIVFVVIVLEFWRGR